MPETSFMQQAIEVASRGQGWVNPNPQVGAVLVKDGRVVGTGFHERFGQPHAEPNAIADAGQNAEGATLYVTLEPCCHFGKTPPCTETIIEHKISKVVVGSRDPNPEVSGKGLRRLQEAGIEVVAGFMEKECDRINRIFFHYIRTQTPYVLMKYAMTIDGKIATRGRDSKWITGEEARRDVHKIRARYASIMVGVGTVFADDPLLNCRLDGGHNPLRIICDSRLVIPVRSQIVQTASAQPTLIVTTISGAEKTPRKVEGLEEAGCEVLVMPTKGHFDLRELMRLLGERKIDSVLLEGGATLHGAALDSGIVNALRCYVAPKIFGGQKALSPVGGLGVLLPDEAHRLTDLRVEQFGSDFCFEGELVPSEVK